MEKRCSSKGCLKVKPLSEFNRDKHSSDGYTFQCKSCRNKRRIVWRDNNKNRKNIVVPDTSTCAQCFEEKSGTLFFKDSEKTNGLSSWCKVCWKKYKIKNAEKINARSRDWYQNNKEKARPVRAKYFRELRKNDPTYVARSLVSKSVLGILKKNNGTKQGNSVWKYLPYSPLQLREHIEKQFEGWMNWENYGKANKEKRTWQVDHTIPQSKLPYDSLDHPNFQKCWALENLRPLEAIENIKKSNKILFTEELTNLEMNKEGE